MNGHWTDCPVQVIDFEGSRASGIVEYGVASLSGGTILSTHTRICAPICAIPEAETRVHGLSRMETAGAAPFAEDMELFMSLRGSGTLSAHNAGFEKHLLKAQWPYPRLSPDFICPGAELADWGPWIDTLRLYEVIYPDLGDYGLSSLLDTFGLRERLYELAAVHCPEKRRRPHCALYDALGSALLLMHLGSLPGYEDLSLRWLVEHSSSGKDAAGQLEMF